MVLLIYIENISVSYMLCAVIGTVELFKASILDCHSRKSTSVTYNVNDGFALIMCPSRS